MAVKKKNEETLDSIMIPIAFPEFQDLLECRELIDDCLAGQKTIKEKGKYLPPTKWQKKHPEKYQEFLHRALFPCETKYSLDIYEGLFHLGMPQIVLPEDGSMDYIIDDASVTRDGLKQIQVRLNKEQMSHGLRCMLLEVRDDMEKPFFIQEYAANKFLRAHFTDKFVSGESVADVILLNESRVENDLATWSYTPVIEIRVLALDRNMEYYQRVISPAELKDFNPANPPMDDRTVYPEYQGRRFNRIPFVWCGASGLSGSAMDAPPMLSMAQTELKLFLCMAHNSQHIFMNTQESIVITGASNSFKLKDDEFVAGSVVVIPGEYAKAQYLSTNGIGFDAEEKEIARLQNSIEQKRLSLMSAKSHQSGTVVGLVQNSQSAPLRTVVDVSGEALTLILRHMARWMGHKPEAVERISYTPSCEFANPRVNLSEFISLCKAVAAGDVKMLEEDLYIMAREAGFIRSKLTWDQFKKKYDLEWEEREQKGTNIPRGSGNPFADIHDDADPAEDDPETDPDASAEDGQS